MILSGLARLAPVLLPLYGTNLIQKVDYFFRSRPEVLSNKEVRAAWPGPLLVLVEQQDFIVLHLVGEGLQGLAVCSRIDNGGKQTGALALENVPARVFWRKGKR